MTRFSPAKINLYLKVGPRRDDGFHGLVSWFITTTLHDTLHFESRADGLITLQSSDPCLPTDQTNLIIRAATGLQQLSGNARGCAIKLEKRIPMGAGLGGGSSNAACTLLALRELWQLDLPLQHLRDLGASLGSDVPFFLHAPSAICRGRGEIVHPVPLPSYKWALVLLPDIHMPTPQVYRRFDEMNLGSDLSVAPAVDSLASLPAQELLTHLFNDLEAPAFAISPKLARLHSDAEALLGRSVRMSGSGSSLFTLYDSASEATAASKQVIARLPLKALAVELA